MKSLWQHFFLQSSPNIKQFFRLLWKHTLKAKLLWLFLGHFLENLGYILFCHLVTLVVNHLSLHQENKVLTNSPQVENTSEPGSAFPSCACCSTSSRQSEAGPPSPSSPPRPSRARFERCRSQRPRTWTRSRASPDESVFWIDLLGFARSETAKQD